MIRDLFDGIFRVGAGFALFFEREAGYHVISMLLIFLGVQIMDPSQRGQIARDLVMIGTGWLGRSMVGKSGKSA